MTLLKNKKNEVFMMQEIYFHFYYLIHIIMSFLILQKITKMHVPKSSGIKLAGMAMFIQYN